MCFTEDNKHTCWQKLLISLWFSILTVESENQGPETLLLYIWFFSFITDRVFVRLCFVPWDDRKRRVSLAEGRISFIKTFCLLRREGRVFICVCLCVYSLQDRTQTKMSCCSRISFFTFFTLWEVFIDFMTFIYKSGISTGLIFMCVKLMQLQIQIQM